MNFSFEDIPILVSQTVPPDAVVLLNPRYKVVNGEKVLDEVATIEASAKIVNIGKAVHRD